MLEGVFEPLGSGGLSDWPEGGKFCPSREVESCLVILRGFGGVSGRLAARGPGAVQAENAAPVFAGEDGIRRLLRVVFYVGSMAGKEGRGCSDFRKCADVLRRRVGGASHLVFIKKVWSGRAARNRFHQLQDSSRADASASVYAQATIALDFGGVLAALAAQGSPPPRACECRCARAHHGNPQFLPEGHGVLTFSQSLRNCSCPRSVRGCLKSCSNTLKGIVATCAPALAASTTCNGCRSDAARICVLKP